MSKNILHNLTILIILLLVSQSEQLTYDSGFFEGFTSECKTGYSTKGTITFHGSFQNVPQVFLGLEYLDTYQNSDFRVNVQNVQTTSIKRIISSNLGFDLFLSCHTIYQVWTIKYYWYAIDDKRKQVINNFNNLSPDNQVFDHQIPNTNFVILSVISYGEISDIDFKLSISSITKTQVSVSITKMQENLKIQYNLVIKLFQELMKLFWTQIKYSTSTYNSWALTQYPNRWLFLGYNGHQQISMSFRQKFILCRHVIQRYYFSLQLLIMLTV